MRGPTTDGAPRPHGHVFLGAGHAAVERRAWAVIALCTGMMLLELGGGWLFGSLALVADGLHMSTHAMAMLIAAFAYSFARRHAANPAFSFGTGKLGDLAGFTNAIVLLIIAIFIGYEALARFASPVPIAFAEAIPIAALGLVVNLLSAWLLSGGTVGHQHSHGRAAARAPAAPGAHDDHHDRHGEHDGHAHGHRHGGVHAHAHRDHNLRAIFFHVASDAAVSVLAILGLTAARYLGWMWMDPAMGIVGAVVITVWAGGLLRDTGRVLLDITPDTLLASRIRSDVEATGDRVFDLHLWRLGPGHLGAILSVATAAGRDAGYYRALLARYADLSHVTIEVSSAG